MGRRRRASADSPRCGNGDFHTNGVASFYNNVDADPRAPAAAPRVQPCTFHRSRVSMMASVRRENSFNAGERSDGGWGAGAVVVGVTVSPAGGAPAAGVGPAVVFDAARERAVNAQRAQLAAEPRNNARLARHTARQTALRRTRQAVRKLTRVARRPRKRRRAGGEAGGAGERAGGGGGGSAPRGRGLVGDGGPRLGAPDWGRRGLVGVGDGEEVARSVRGDAAGIIGAAFAARPKLNRTLPGQQRVCCPEHDVEPDITDTSDPIPRSTTPTMTTTTTTIR